MKIFLLGATGSTGYETLKKLVRDGYKVKVLARNPDKLDLTEIEQSQANQIEVIEGGVFEQEKLKEHFAGWKSIPMNLFIRSL